MMKENLKNMANDCVGNKIKKGDFLLRAIREGNSANMTFAMVSSVIKDEIKIIPIKYSYKKKCFISTKRLFNLIHPENVVVYSMEFLVDESLQKAAMDEFIKLK